MLIDSEKLTNMFMSRFTNEIFAEILKIISDLEVDTARVNAELIYQKISQDDDVTLSYFFCHHCKEKSCSDAYICFCCGKTRGMK